MPLPAGQNSFPEMRWKLPGEIESEMERGGIERCRIDERGESVARPERARRDQNDTVVVKVTRRGSPTAMIRLLLLDG